MPKNPRVKTLLGSQHVKGPKHRLILHGRIFLIFFDHCERK